MRSLASVCGASGLALTLFGGVLAGATGARADVSISTGNPGGGVSNVLFVTNNTGANTQFGTVNGIQITYTSTDLITTPSGGQARIADTNDAGFDNLEWSIAAGTGYTLETFNLFTLTNDPGQTVTFTVFDQFGVANLLTTDTFDLDGGENRFTLEASAGELITLVSFVVNGALESFRQDRIGGVQTIGEIPIPGALVLFATGLAGMALLRRRQSRRSMSPVAG